MRRLVFLFAFFFGMTASVLAEDVPISVKAEVNKASITIGDPVQYTVTIKHAPSIQILSSIPVPAPDVFKVQKVQDIKGREGEKQVAGRKMTLTAFQLGDFVLDPVKIEYRVGSSNPQTIETEKIYITVKSVAQGEVKTDIRGVKSTLQLKGKVLWIVITILLLVFAIAGYLIYRRLTQGKGILPEAPEEIKTPEEEALANLNRLFDSDLLRRGKTKEYYLQLSEILRIYFEKRFHILAVESTTYEILRSLAQNDVDGDLRRKISEVLEAADLAKFAKWVPEPSETVQINQKSKQIIEAARPKEVTGGI